MVTCSSIVALNDATRPPPPAKNPRSAVIVSAPGPAGADACPHPVAQNWVPVEAALSAVFRASGAPEESPPVRLIVTGPLLDPFQVQNPNIRSPRCRVRPVAVR